MRLFGTAAALLLVAVACWRGSGPRARAPIAAAAVARVVADPSGAAGRLEVSASVHNVADSTVLLSYGHCSMNVRVYGPGRAPAVWSLDAWAPVDPRTGRPRSRTCLLYEIVERLAPGATSRPMEFRRSIPVADILGDSLPPGRYRVEAALGVLGGYTADAGPVGLGR